MIRAVLALAALALPGAAVAQSSPSDFTAAVRYDDGSRVTGTIAPDPDGTGPLHYAATRTTYDAAGRVTRVETGELSSWQSESVAPSAWSGFTVQSQVDTDYDALDRKVKVTVSSGGTASSVTQYSYDAVGRPDCVAVRMNPATWSSLPSSACDLATTSSTYGPDRITKNVYDNAGQLLKVIKAYRVTTANGFAQTLQEDYVTYAYTANGKPARVIDANGNVAGYTYDGFDRLAKWSFPSTAANGTISTTDYESYTYDANGNRLTFRKRDGRTFGYTYDNLNRLTVKSVPGACVSGYACTTPPSSAVRDVYYGYDAQGLMLYARFDSATGADRVDNAYDGFGRLSSQTSAMYGVSRTVSYLYDANSNRIRITHPDGNYWTTDYDGLDRVIAVKENGSATVATMGYDTAGRETSETRDTVATTFGYDGVGRLLSLADDLPGGTTNDLTSTFAYNPASQLVSRVRSNPTPYAWTGYTNVSRSYTANGLNQYTAAGSATLGYDSNGNLVSDGTTSYTYDAENRLVDTTYGGGTTFVYDPLGRLYGFAGSAAKSTVYDGDQRIADYTADPAVIQFRYVMGPGTDNPLLWYAGNDLSDRRSLQADERGSIVSAVTSAGAVYGINSYDEYGIPGALNVGRYGYTGQVWMSSVGMWYYKARFYSPTLGRFMQTDPIGYADQNNLYAYVNNDPMSRRDPKGLETYNCTKGVGTSNCNGGTKIKAGDRIVGKNGTIVIGRTDGPDKIRPAVRRGDKAILSQSQVTNVIYNETRSASGPGIKRAREKFAQAVINGDEMRGAKRPPTASTSADVPSAETGIYAEVAEAVKVVLVEREVGYDPTYGAIYANLRNDDSTANFSVSGTANATRDGPFTNSFPTKALGSVVYIDTYFPD